MHTTILDNYGMNIIHICSSCDSTRNEHGEWRRNATPHQVHPPGHCLSHGLCPACAKKLYPELFLTRPEKQDVAQSTAD